MSHLTVGVLAEHEVEAALALSGAEGWNQTGTDWQRLFRLEPSGCFAACDGERLVGTVTTTTYGTTLAWIGMMLVDPDQRGRGLGRRLMQLATDHLRAAGVATLGLDATPMGRPLYESLGFVAVGELERWQGIAKTAGHDAPRTSPHDGLPSLFALDEGAFGADRSRVLTALVSEASGEPLVVTAERGEPIGYALPREGRSATYIGPIVAGSAQSAAELVDGMLQRFAGGRICLDLHRHGVLQPELLAARGLTYQRPLTRMQLGVPLVGVHASSLCASAGPELG